MNLNLLPELRGDSVRVRVTDDLGRLVVTHVVALADASEWEAQTIRSLDQTDERNGLDPTDRTHTTLRQLKGG